MRILYDYQTFLNQRFGGVSRYHFELYNALKTKHDVTVFAPYTVNQYFHGGNDVSKNLNNDLFYLRRRYYHWVSQRATVKMLKETCFDIIHPTWYYTYMIPVCSGKMVVTIHDLIHERYYGKKAALEIYHKKEYIKHADAVIAVSENTKKDILYYYPDTPEGKIKVIYHGINSLSIPENVTNFSGREKNGLPEKYLLFVGNRQGYKRADSMLRAVSPLLQKDKELFMVFIGGGKTTKTELAFLKDHNLADKVLFFDASDEMLACAYSNAVCLVYPSEYEGFGFPILEAFESGCPVICSNNSSLPEVGGDAALYFDVNDEEGMRECVKQVMDNDDLREAMIDKGRKRCKIFSWEKCAKETIGLYLQIL